MARIKKGEDKTVTITIESQGVVLDLDGYNIVVIVYSNEIGVIGRFSRQSDFVDSSSNKYDPIDVTDESGGEIEVNITKDMTSKAAEGAVFAVVKLRHIATNTYVEADPVKIGNIVKTPATGIVEF